MRRLRLRPAELRAAARATTAIVLVDAGLHVLTADRLGRALGVPLLLRDAPPLPPLRPEQVDPHDRAALRLLAAASRRFGLRRSSPCLRSSLAAGLLLRRHHPVLRIGVARAGEDVLAHAWLETDRGSLFADPAFAALG